jgi:inosine-uridine nucleoside N-ribohydrolase
MKLLAAILLALAFALPASAATPLHIIFDTDMGNDVDDALALAMLHAFISRGEADLLAVTVSKDNPWAAEYVQMEDEYYGRGGIPVGLVHDGKTKEDGNYVRQVCEMHGRHPGQYKEAVEVLRKTLAREQDGAVSMIQVGFSTNLARLLDSPPDQYSPLNGMDLVKKKVRLLTVMAGNFAANKGEYNVITDIPAAQKVFTTWPTPTYFSGFEVGEAILYPAVSIENDFPSDSPVAQAYKSYMKMPYDRPSWDLTTVLYDLRPDRGYFDISPPGKVTVTEKGLTHFEKAAQGDRYYLKVSATQAALARDACVWLSSQPKSRAHEDDHYPQ